MTEKYLDVLEGTEYKVEVSRSEDGFDEISLTKDVYHADGYIVDYDLLAEETIYGGVTIEGITNFASREISKAKKSESLYGTYTGKKETNGN